MEVENEILPVALTEGMQAELVSDFCSIHGIRKILFVSKHEQHCISQLILPKSAIIVSLSFYDKNLGP